MLKEVFTLGVRPIACELCVSSFESCLSDAVKEFNDNSDQAALLNALDTCVDNLVDCARSAGGRCLECALTFQSCYNSALIRLVANNINVGEFLLLIGTCSQQLVDCVTGANG